MEFGQWLSHPPPGEEVVISGMSGRFPKSNNVYEFRENLFNKVDMVSQGNRWNMKHPEIPDKLALIDGLDKLDAGYFGLPCRQAQAMMPTTRKFLETAMEAVIDAGVHPSELAGSKTGVFVGSTWGSAELSSGKCKTYFNKYFVTGSLGSMIANRVSYFLKLKGPSYSVDTACSSSMNALINAHKAIRCGQCDNAIVGGVNIILDPFNVIHFYRLGVLSSTGACKVFDEDADGYVKSETAACVFLQKAKNSRRIYAQIVHAKVNCDGFKKEGITFPSSQCQEELIKRIYEESGVDPSELSYMEAHGTGTQVGDPEEIQSIDMAIGQRRQTPLLIGSVKSAIGHSEPSSGIAALIKVLIALDTGRIPPNVNLKKIKKDLTGLVEGRLKVVTETTNLDEKGVVGVNNFGFGGSNCHLLLRSFTKRKSVPELIEDDMPRLVCVSGRNEEAVLTILNDVNQRSLDKEFIGLLHEIFKINTDSHFYRGFTIISKKGPLKTSLRKVPAKRLLLCVDFRKFENSFDDICQYFLQFSVFKSAIFKINKILKIDLEDRKNYVNRVVATIAVQIGILDVLEKLELHVDEIISNDLISKYFLKITTLEETMAQALSKSTLLTQIKPQSKSLFTLNFSGGIVNFLENLGRLYENGYNPQIQKLYNQVSFPVSRNTPMVSPLIKWNYKNSWYLPTFCGVGVETLNHYTISLKRDESKFIAGHVIDGRNLFPATGFLDLAWQKFAFIRTLQVSDCPVTFENCRFLRAVPVSKTRALNFMVSIQTGTGNFEIYESNYVVVTGKISMLEEADRQEDDNEESVLEKSETLFSFDNEEMVLGKSDIYKELGIRGYNYSGMFQGIEKANLEASKAFIKWEDNWVTFMDNMLQTKILQINSRCLYVPVGIKRITINPHKHLKIAEHNSTIPTYANRDNNSIKSGGIEIWGVQARSITRRKPKGDPVLEKYFFVPNEGFLSLEQAVRVNVQIILENSLEISVKILEIFDGEAEGNLKFLLPVIRGVLEDLPLITPDLTLSTSTGPEEMPGIKVEPVILSSNSNFSLIVARGVLQKANFLEQVLSALNKKGFVLSREDKCFSPGNIAGIEILTQFTTEEEKFILFRKTEHLTNTVFIEVTSENYEWISSLNCALNSESNVVVYSQNRPTEGILGFANCIRQEPGGKKVNCFFIMDKNVIPFDPENNFYRDQINKNFAVNVYKDMKWGTYRHLLLEDVEEGESYHRYIDIMSKGDLSTIKWIEGPLISEREPDDEKILVFINYAALNFKDVMIATGRVSADVFLKSEIGNNSTLGIEYAGIDSKGRRVMGYVNSGALANIIATDFHMTWPIPNFWTLEEAVTIPAVYSTVIYALLMRTSLKRGTSILIHSAAGGIGIAALNVALHFGCEIFVTVGTEEKKKFLKETYPQIPENHIGNSRDISFEKMIKNETKGRGVDIVLNSLAEEKLKASLRCLARGGRFMEIGKFDLAMDNSLELLLLEKEASYHGVMLDMFFNDTQKMREVLNVEIFKGVAEGYVKPLPRTVFGRDEIESAFRFMMTGKHIGKVIVKIEEEAVASKIPKAIPRFFCKSEKSYVIVGGLGGFGLELAHWLICQGARKLILTSRSGIQDGYQKQRLKLWKSYQISVHILTTDVTTKEGCFELIKKANKLAPIEGIFNLAVVLQDALFEDQTKEKFQISLAPKALATKYLDEVTRELCPHLKYFVVFSSVSCGRGNIGQTNYGMANSIMERICEKRKRDGFPALAIQWGAVGDVGLVAKMQKDNKELVIGGTLLQRISSCLDVLHKFLKQKHPIVGSMVVAEKRNRSTSSSVVDTIASILGIKDIKSVSPHATLVELGMDSMMGTEILQVLEQDFEIYVTAKDARTMTIAKLIELEAEKFKDTQKQDLNLLNGIKALLQFTFDRKTDSIPILPMESLAKPTDKVPTVFVFPGFQGSLQVLEPLTKKLKAHVLGVQYNYIQSENTVTEIAEEISEYILPFVTRSNSFYFVCYSFGVLVCVEIVSLLESKGFSGKIFAVDGSPDYMYRSASLLALEDNDVQMEIMILYNLLLMAVPNEFLEQNKVQEKLKNCSSFEERIEVASAAVPSTIKEHEILKKQNPEGLFKRFRATLCYRFTHNKIKSSLKLFKATYPILTVEDVDYKLGEICEQPVEVTALEADHKTIVEKAELSEAINQELVEENKI